jgi:exopolysaccharide biosynthesis polyprenyl glycosylphosphotransferase
MSSRRQEINTQLNQLVDVVLIAIAFWLSHLLTPVVHQFLAKTHLGKYAGIWIFPSIVPERALDIESYFWAMAVIVPFTTIILEIQGYYSHVLEKSLWRSLRQMIQAVLWIALILFTTVIFLKAQAPPRVFLVLLVFVGGSLLLARQQLLKRSLGKRLESGKLRERVVLAGTPEDIDELLKTLLKNQAASLDIVDRIDIASEPVSRLVDSLHENSVERVIFATDHVHFGKIEQAVNACETEGVEAWLSAHFFQTAIARPTFDTMGDRLMLVFRSTPDASWSLLVKSLIDWCGALAIIVFSSPLWLIAAIGIRASSRGSIFFKQSRSGKHGKPFEMWKFRTMGMDAEEKKKELSDQNQMSGPVFKIDKDPRVFRFGAFLRRWSIDELPQLINVLKGEMSLVGPRPLPVYEVEQISEAAQRRRLSVKPGLTCLWQVNGRNKIESFDEWVALDLKYIDNWSIWLDLQILIKTVPAVIFGSGAR